MLRGQGWTPLTAEQREQAVRTKELTRWQGLRGAEWAERPDGSIFCIANGEDILTASARCREGMTDTWLGEREK
jgi:broad specificity phosphatase PhoE